ncbi:MAG: ribonuclease D, partial [Myxococcaceae bacterium]
LKAFRIEQATARKVTPSVILTNPLMDALAAHPPATAEALLELPYFGEKRRRLYGDKLVALLAPYPVLGT